MLKITPSSLILPEGWIAEEVGKNVISLRRLSGNSSGFVTIDFSKRFFAGGYGYPCELHAKNTRHYSGRGWQKEIVEDAIKWLDSVMQELTQESAK